MTPGGRSRGAPRPAPCGGSAGGHRFYGRRKGHPLRPRQAALVAALLPRLRLDPAAPADPAALFAASKRELWLEIGFGGGEHLAWQAAHNPEIGFIGCEPFLNGVAGLLAEIERRELANIRIWDGDARDLLVRLPDAGIARAFILFPDPWPKKRHWKRRLVAGDTVEELARVLRPGGELRIASDWPGYVDWMLRRLAAHPAFAWTARAPADWRVRPADWPPTRYEAKALAAGRRPAYLTFRRWDESPAPRRAAIAS